MPPGSWMDGIAAQQTGLDFAQVARRTPRLKILVLASFTHGLGLADIQRLRALGAMAQSGGELGLLDKSWAVLFTRAGNLARLRKSPLTSRIIPLSRFKLAGIYRVGFKLKEEGYTGPLSLRVSVPRSDFGKKLISLETLISPRREYQMQGDKAGNHWLVLNLPSAATGKAINLAFHFVYQVDLAVLLAHALVMMPLDEAPALPPESPAQTFLQPSPKIASNDPEIEALATEFLPESLSPRRKYRAIAAFIKKNLPYDWEKRRIFFNGKKVYSDMEDMYNPPQMTLAAGKAACPSTSVLEAALLRAAGVPARTAGRWGHFYSELFVPGRGWLSTSITPTGITLVKDLDHRHQPFVTWAPAVKVQTTAWSGQAKVLLESLHE